ncbi:DNA binding protein [Thelephora ganbajun]|uniref:DNA binding protein n=1 Tax=Thelephora ganbajun TaxID=370292 RepID=A0ACB6ZRX3_THEGA|nr:DNA binding protein [Thelephora ganbajun]
MSDVQTAPSDALTEPKPIIRLKESVVNKIAAGEIIHRPSSALKELIENSLDAGSTSIRVTIKDGGMKLLQIQDNGCGIKCSDLPILAERFTTSKLSSFSDLSHLTTYGFRGEALASISHVAHLSVITKTAAAEHAWKVHYEDGKLVPAKAGQTAEPKPCAGNDGTIITVEDLFYNTPTRLSALRSSTEEYARILDVMTKYAVHNHKVALVCKKAGSSAPDLSSSPSSSTSQAINLLYGTSIGKALLQVTCGPDPNTTHTSKDAESWKAEVVFTNASYQAKKFVFLLFINHRLVESTRIRRAMETIYTSILPKGFFPFMYLSLEINPESVDVNVHPTKREVHFLNEDAIVERVCNVSQERLLHKSQSRSYPTQTLLTQGQRSPMDVDQPGGSQDKEPGPSRVHTVQITSASTSKKKVAPKNLIRTSAADRTLDSMFPVIPSNRTQPQPQPQTEARAQVTTEENSDRGGEGPPAPLRREGSRKTKEIQESTIALTSIKDLRKRIIVKEHQGLHEVLEGHVFVGIVDLDRCLSLVQHSTQLYLLNHGSLAEELFYQLGLRQFSNFAKFKLEPAPPLRKLISIAVDAEDGISRTKLTKEQVTEFIYRTLIDSDRREMLSEYFCLTITDEGLVQTLPLILRGYIPNLDKLPLLLMRLGPQVDWTDEERCFESILRELAYFYVPGPLDGTPTTPEETEESKAEKWQIEHVLFPAMRKYLVPPKSLLERDVVQVASLPDLYRVFERC